MAAKPGQNEPAISAAASSSAAVATSHLVRPFDAAQRPHAAAFLSRAEDAGIAGAGVELFILKSLETSLPPPYAASNDWKVKAELQILFRDARGVRPSRS